METCAACGCSSVDIACCPQSGGFVAQRDEKWSTLLAVLPKIVGLVGGLAARLASMLLVRKSAVRGAVTTSTVAICALAVAAVVSGCSGDEAEPSGLPSLTTTSSASWTPSTATTVPSPPVVARERTSDGAAAFVRFYIALINNAYRTGASGPLRKYAAPSCDSCTSIAAAVDDIYNDGGHAEGGQLSIKSLVPSVIDEDIQPTVVVATSTDAFVRFDMTGKVTHRNPASSRTLLFDLKWTTSAWQVVGIRSEKGDTA
jgi:Family of unknown function (DUF6318)